MKKPPTPPKRPVPAILRQMDKLANPAPSPRPPAKKAARGKTR